MLSDLEAIQAQKQQQNDKNTTKCSKKKRIDYNYQVREMVRLKFYDPIKLQERFKGPYHQIVQVFINGTVHLQNKARYHYTC